MKKKPKLCTVSFYIVFMIIIHIIILIIFLFCTKSIKVVTCKDTSDCDVCTFVFFNKSILSFFCSVLIVILCC